MITLSLSAFSFALPAQQQQQQQQQAPITGAIPFTFRNATLDDLDDMTTVYVDAFSTAPPWKYTRQFADLYPNYTWTCQREHFEQMYRNNTAEGSAVFKVISVPDPSSHRKERVVSLSAWQLGLLNQADDESFTFTSIAGLQTGVLSKPMHSSTEPAKLGFDCDAHLDMNMTRVQSLLKVMLEAEDKYLTKPYGPQFRLGLLATHPDWDGNGFAAKHLHWGKEALAEWNQAPEYVEHRLPLTLIGTPAGYPLYISEGFEGLKNITIERLDGQEALWFEAMKYEAKGE